MRNNLLFSLIFLSFCFFQSNAQNVLLSEDFEDGTLGIFTSVDGDMLPVNTNVGALQGGFVVLEVADGEYRALATSWFTNVQTADNWLISPEFEVQNTGTTIVWDASTDSGSYRDGYRVMVSTTGSDPADFTTEILSVSAEETELNTKSASLDDFIGQNVRFAFHHNSTDKLILRLDNITVVELPESNIELTLNTAQYPYKNVDSASDLSFTVSNYGYETVNNFTASYVHDGATITEEFTGLSLGSYQSQEFTFTETFGLTNPDAYVISLEATNPNGKMDADMSNNTTDFMYIGVQDAPDKKMLVEEGTGTWCVWCPRGSVFMEKVEKDYSDDLVGVAVHRGATGWVDPMEVSSYTDFFVDLVDGYPSLAIDRAFSTGIPGLTNMTAFAESLVTFNAERPSPIGVDVDAVYNYWTDEIQINIDGTYHSNLDDDRFSLAVLITEDSINVDDFAYRQANAYADNANGAMEGFESLSNPVDGADMIYNHTLRTAIGGFGGDDSLIDAEISVGGSFSTVLNYSIPSSQDKDQLNVVVVIIDNESGGIAVNAETDKVLENIVSSTQNQELNNNIAIFPNPANGAFTHMSIDLEEKAQVKVAILDILGKRVANFNLGTLNGVNNVPLDLSSISTGSYNLLIEVNDEFITKKLTVVK